MAKGWDEIEQQSAALAEQRERFGEGFKPELRVGAKNAGPFIVRFLEQGPDVNNFPVHEYKIPNPNVRGGFSHRRFTCLSEVGQECPGCNAGMKIKRRGVYNLIQRQRPVFRKGQDNKTIYVNDQPIIDGYQDTVVIANVGGPTAELLRKYDGTYGGLMSRDFEVVYSGDSFQAWTISPVLDGQGNAMATPMSEADHALAAAKHNLDEYMKPPSFQDAARIVAQYGGHSGASSASPGAGPQGQQAQPPGGNNFLAGADIPAGAAVNTFGQQPDLTQQQAPPPQASPPAQAAPPAEPPAAPAPTT